MLLIDSFLVIALIAICIFIEMFGQFDYEKILFQLISLFINLLLILKKELRNMVIMFVCLFFQLLEYLIFYYYMEENPIDASEINLRNKGLKNSMGKVHKGCVKDAFTKLSIGSIPSNYESIIYHHQQKKGFGTSQRRFYLPQTRSEIGKGQSQSRVIEGEQVNTHKPSESKKGFGALIAKQKRQYLKMSFSPGPGKYINPPYEKGQIQGVKSYQHKKKKCYTIQQSQLKRKEILSKIENIDLPGPGYYQIQDVDKHRLAGCKSAFINKEKRDAYIPKQITPGPGCYVGKEEQKQLADKQKKRQAQKDQFFTKIVKQKRPKSKLFIKREKLGQSPGPGAYYSQLPNFKPLYEKIKISSNFMQSSKDRFDEPFEKKVEEYGVSPGAYEIKSTFDKVEKKLIDMPCFMSQSRRQPFAGVGLGPNIFYEGNKQNRKNFHFNIRGQWL